MVELLYPKLLTREASLIGLARFLRRPLAFIKIAHEFIIIPFADRPLLFLLFVLEFSLCFFLFVFLRVFLFFLTFYALIARFLIALFRCLLGPRFILVRVVFYDGV